MNLKFDNIADPLDITNNVGKSVSKFNSHRIKNAFKFAAKKIKLIEKHVDNDKIIEKLSELFKSCFMFSSKTPFLKLPSPQIIISTKDIDPKPAPKSDEDNSSNLSSIPINISDRIKNNIRTTVMKKINIYDMIYPFHLSKTMNDDDSSHKPYNQA